MIPTLQTFLRTANAEQRYLYEERAGIIEFCGNVPREVAEEEAALQVFGLTFDEFSDRYIKPLVAASVKDSVFGVYPNGCPILGEGPQRDDL
jgi:hypothetical protein